jgi:ribulose-5-phosphate 4-epimerase/fuculose-1-phosphate aldolase
MHEISRHYLDSFIRCAHRIARHQLVTCSSGNLSRRVGDQVMISARGSWLSELRSDDIAICDLATGDLLNRVQPSLESKFHLQILRTMEADVVLHYQAPYSTQFACSAHPPSDLDIIPEIPYYIGEVGVVPYLDPGSDALADAVSGAMQHHNLILLRNHGQVVTGKSFREVLQRAAFLEMAAKMVILSSAPLQRLPEAAVEQLRGAAEAGI